MRAPEVREIATGGDPSGALVRELAQWSLEGRGVHHVSIAHDDGCPCTQHDMPLPWCTCEIVELHLRKRNRRR